MKIRSIRIRLIVSTSLIITTVLFVGSLSIYHSVKTSLYQQIDEVLLSTLRLQMLELEIDGDVVAHDWLEEILGDPQRVRQEYQQVWRIGSEETLRSPALGGDEELPRLGNESEGYEYRDVILSDGTRLRAVGSTIFPKLEEDSEVLVNARDFPFKMTVARETRHADDALIELRNTLVLGQVIAVALSFTVIVFVTRKSLQPIASLEEKINRVDIGDPNFSMDVPEEFPSELHGLILQYNDLLSRVNQVRQRERDFATNVAHELRTPLAGISATLEQALSKKRECLDYQIRIGEALEATKHMHELLEVLMRYARLRPGIVPLEMEVVLIQPIIDECIDRYSDLLEFRGLKVTQDIVEEGQAVKTDRALIGILLGNLIGNAAAYADERSIIQVSVRVLGRGVEIEIINQASDLAEGELSRICEPFYRRDSARTVDGSHYGIGLALCKEICDLLGLQFEINLNGNGKFFAKVVFSETSVVICA